MISAVVINWNGRAHLERCLPALLAQEPPPDEVVLVDNHSSDGSREYCAEHFPSVRILDTGANLGPAEARDRGARAVRGETLLFLDNDVELLPGALAELRGVLDEDRRIGMVQARSLCEGDNAVVHYDHSDLHFLGTLVLHNWFRPRSEVTDPDGPVGAVIALCLLVRRRAYFAAGGFDRRLFILYEDNDLSWRMRMHGWQLRLAPRALVRHFAGTAGLSFRSPDAKYAGRRFYLHCRNRWLVLLRNAQLRTLILTAPSQLLYALVYTLFAASRGGLLPALRGHGAALLAVPSRLWMRRIQRRRKVGDRDLLSGDPMTPNPGLADRGAKAWLRCFVDGFCALNWKLVRGLCG